MANKSKAAPAAAAAPSEASEPPAETSTTAGPPPSEEGPPAFDTIAVPGHASINISDQGIVLKGHTVLLQAELESARQECDQLRGERDQLLAQLAARAPAPLPVRHSGRYRVVGPGNIVVGGRMHSAGEIFSASEAEALSLGPLVTPVED